MRNLVFLFLVVFSLPTWAVTYYLDTSCSLNGDGTGASGACAASGGGAGAYNTGASIVFGAGDTIYIKRGTTVTNFPSPVSQAVTIDDYGDSSAACPIISKSSTFALSLSASGVTINDICLTGDNTSAILNISATNASLNRIKVYGNTDNTGIGIRFNTGSEGSSLSSSEVHSIDDDGIGIGSGVTGSSAITITDLYCHDVDKNNSSGDCIQAYTNTAAVVIVDGGRFYKETVNKQAIIYDGTGELVVKGTPYINVVGGAQGIQTAGTGSALIFNPTIVMGPLSAKGIQVTNTGNTFINQAKITGGIDGIYVSHASGTAKVINSSITGQSNSSIYNTTGGSLAVNSTHMSAPTSLYDASSNATLISDYNTFGIPSFQWNGSAINTLTTWQSTSSQDSNSVISSGFVAKRTTRN